jgi:hypothetical protein
MMGKLVKIVEKGVMMGVLKLSAKVINVSGGVNRIILFKNFKSEEIQN